MFGRHGVIGGNIFLVSYVIAVAGPLLRILSASPSRTKLAAVAIVLVTALVTVLAIRVFGGGGAGEPIGCLTAILVWAGWVLAPRIFPQQLHSAWTCPASLALPYHPS